uniref:Uncharacterized protein n=1 Tax=Caenorhabditis japonica TaxID=281687 RepID=A0A8R1EM73_CAEJA
MNPNQPPNYPPGQYPGHPGDHYPPMYPPGMQQHPSHYMHPQQTTPQFPQSQAPNFMNVQVKQEPTWNQDSRYGMGSSQTQQHVPHYPGSGMAGMGMMGGGQMPMDISMEARNL